MTYVVDLLPRARKALTSLPLQAHEAVLQQLVSLTENPRPAGCRKLKGREGWRIRIGSIRVVYRIDDRNLVVTLVDVGHRKDVYR